MMLCQSCRQLIVEYCSRNFASGGFNHGPLSQPNNSTHQGCEICGFVSKFLHTTQGNYSPWISKAFEQSTLYWSGLQLELYEPGHFACTGSSKRAALIDEVDPSAAKFYYPFYKKDNEARFDVQTDLAPRTDHDTCFEIARMWIDYCIHGHPRCAARGLDSELPTRVIDVGPENGNPRLIESVGKKGSYVTLSHRWGGDLPFKTTEANISSYKREIALEGMPATFRDAVTVCRRLGVQYLWIDALCIIQDSPQDWSHEAGKMASIYSKSLFTISALHASSSYGGLFVDRDVRPHAVFQSPQANGSVHKPMGIRLASPTFDDEMSASSLFSRGWVYQEKVLSTAVLHYGANQMFWECRSRVMSESANQIRHKNNAYTYFFQRSLTMVRYDGQSADVVWENVVTDFTKKEFTVKTDKLPAILGVATRFGSLANFAVGMWHPFIAKHLLWAYDPPESTNGQTKDVVDTNSRPRNPTWSWVSVDYPVHHVVPVGMDEFRPVCEILNFDDLGNPDLAAHRNNSADLGLKIRGPGFRLNVQKSQNRGARTRRSQSFFQHIWQIGEQIFALDCQLDPSCQIKDENTYLLQIGSVSGMGATPVAATSFFLLLEESGIKGRFKRVGWGGGPLDAMRLIFRSEGNTELIID